MSTTNGTASTECVGCTTPDACRSACTLSIFQDEARHMIEAINDRLDWLYRTRRSLTVGVMDDERGEPTRVLWEVDGADLSARLPTPEEAIDRAREQIGDTVQSFDDDEAARIPSPDGEREDRRKLRDELPPTLPAVSPSEAEAATFGAHVTVRQGQANTTLNIPAPAAASPVEREAPIRGFCRSCKQTWFGISAFPPKFCPHCCVTITGAAAALPAEPARTPSDDDAATRVLEVLELSRRLSAQASVWRTYAEHRDSCRQCRWKSPAGLLDGYALDLCPTGQSLRALATEDANG